MSANAHDIKNEVKGYIVIFLALITLCVATTAISYLHLKTPLAVVVALAIATLQACLAVFYFMHLISEKKLLYTVLSITLCFFVTLLMIPFGESLSVPEGTYHTQMEHTVPPAVAEHGHAQEGGH